VGYLILWCLLTSCSFCFLNLLRILSSLTRVLYNLDLWKCLLIEICSHWMTDRNDEVNTKYYYTTSGSAWEDHTLGFNHQFNRRGIQGQLTEARIDWGKKRGWFMYIGMGVCMLLSIWVWDFYCAHEYAHVHFVEVGSLWSIRVQMSMAAHL